MDNQYHYLIYIFILLAFCNITSPSKSQFPNDIIIQEVASFFIEETTVKVCFSPPAWIYWIFSL